MKIYNVAKDTPCFVVSDITDKHAAMKSFFTRKDLSFGDLSFDRIRNHNQSSAPFKEVSNANGWNRKVVERAIQLVLDRGMMIFQEKNRNGATSLLIVAQEDVETLA